MTLLINTAFDLIAQSYTFLIQTPAGPAPTAEPTVEPTVEPTIEPTPVPITEPTSEPDSAVVSGQVILNGRAGFIWLGAVVTIDDTGQSSTSDLIGNFSIPDVAGGSHTSITADAPGYLPAVCAAPLITGSEIKLTPVSLLSGDLNDDNHVDVADATMLGVSFGSTDPNTPTDINKDALVDIFDIILLSINFGQSTQAWNCLSE